MKLIEGFFVLLMGLGFVIFYLSLQVALITIAATLALTVNAALDSIIPSLVVGMCWCWLQYKMHGDDR